MGWRRMGKGCLEIRDYSGGHNFSGEKRCLAAGFSEAGAEQHLLGGFKGGAGRERTVRACVRACVHACVRACVNDRESGREP